jgi:probable phosphoglycerate mutase
MVGLLIRHGHCDAIGRSLAGRREGVPLSAVGTAEAARLSGAFRWLPLAAVYSSPLERAVSTAEPIAREHGLQVHTREALIDVNFGDWTGRSLTALEQDPAWAAFNRDRAHARAPGGEALSDVQRRIVEELKSIDHAHRGELVAIVTHAEPIRCAIAAFTGQSLDEVLGVEISPGHVSAVGMGSKFCSVLAVNLRPELAAV